MTIPQHFMVRCLKHTTAIKLLLPVANGGTAAQQFYDLLDSAKE